MVMADWDGNVHASIAGIAHMAGVTKEECAASLVWLSSPDQYGPSKKEDGRTIVPIEGGWHIVNFLDDNKEFKRNRKLGEAQKAYAKFLQTPVWKKLSAACIERDGHKCTECESTEILQAHHLFYRENWWDTELEDLITLCRDCHHAHHFDLS